MRLVALACIGLACVIGSGCASSHRDGQHTSSSDAAVPAFHWVAGHWEDASGAHRFEEGWFAERGGAMVGTFQLIGKRGPMVYEFMRVASADDRIEMQITHFGGDGTQWPNQPVVFRSTSVSDGRIVLAQDGVPDKVLTYERTGADTMRVTLADPDDAKPSIFEFRRAR